MAKKNITIESLARMIKKGFDETAKKEEVNRQFYQINERFDRIEKLILANHKRRIERLEEEMKELRGLLALK